jgi:hypothetical protein
MTVPVARPGCWLLRRDPAKPGTLGDYRRLQAMKSSALVGEVLVRDCQRTGC